MNWLTGSEIIIIGLHAGWAAAIVVNQSRYSKHAAKAFWTAFFVIYSIG